MPMMSVVCKVFTQQYEVVTLIHFNEGLIKKLSLHYYYLSTPDWLCLRLRWGKKAFQVELRLRSWATNQK